MPEYKFASRILKYSTLLKKDNNYDIITLNSVADVYLGFARDGSPFGKLASITLGMVRGMVSVSNHRANGERSRTKTSATVWITSEVMQLWLT
jgi:hypothetical protein